MFGQINLRGKVIDLHDGQGLGFAVIKEKEHNEGCQTDSAGNFSMILDHAGIHTFTISHVGCKKNVISFYLRQDTFLTLYLDHDEKRIKKVSIKGNKINYTNLQNSLGKDIGSKIQELPGGSLIQSGSNINKPALNGIHSHRLVLNFDNMRFESQQWGVEHAPEIDANSLQRMRLVQGSEAFLFGSEAISGALKFEPDYGLAEDKKMAGSFKAGTALNGRRFLGSGMIKTILFNRFTFFAQSTASIQGNIKAPSYYLANTGFKEWNFSSGLNFRIKDANFTFYYSRFYNELGILAASHIGNLQDLQEAIKRGAPNDSAGFSYAINNPSQKVYHEIIKSSIHIPLKKNTLTIHVSNQYNLRNEYDFILNVANRDRPVSNLTIATQQIQGIYLMPNMRSKNTLSLGGQLQQNDFGGTFLIPKYQSQKYYAFWFKEIKINPTTKLNHILRFDGEQRTIKDRIFDSTTATKSYNDISASVDLVYSPNEQQEHKIQLATAWRPPHVIEQYSNGIHHGAASYEIGNDSLRKERNIGLNYYSNYKLSDIQLNINPYIYYYFNYLNAAPSGTLTQTIRGFFPTWRFNQYKVIYYGINVTGQYQISREWSAEVRYQYLKIREINSGLTLPFTPQNSVQSTISYLKNFKKSEQSINAALQFQYFFKRSDIDTAKDYAIAPEGYPMLNFNISYKFNQKKLPLLLEFSTLNVLNTAYRNYADRLRYFSDTRGIDIQLKLFLTF